VTGKGLHHEEDEARQDYDNAVCILLTVYHQKDLFTDYAEYKRLLQRHIRRGLREFRNGWRDSHDFHEYLYQELLAGEVQGKVDTDLADRLTAALLEIGVRVEIRRVVDGPRLTRVFMYLPVVDDLDRIKRGQEKLAHLLGLGDLSIFLSTTHEPKVIALDVPRKSDTWATVVGHRLVEWVDGYRGDAQLPVWPGVDVLGEPFVLDLATAPHLLVGGTTGSGKSVCLNALIVSLLRGPSRKQLQLCLIDPKRVEFEPYGRMTNLFSGSVITDVQQAHVALEELVIEMEARTQLIAKTGARDLAEAHGQGRMQDVHYIVVVVEELADLLMQARDLEEPLIRLAQKARATGIHLVLATQRPDSATFSGLLRSNIPCRIALTVQKSSESKIILDEVGAEKLTGHGDMLVRTPLGTSRVHGVKVGLDDIAAAISCYQGRA
jgi:DNA segregation ATPase FtsK/SpoIIIE, S-DNA-T family